MCLALTLTAGQVNEVEFPNPDMAFAISTDLDLITKKVMEPVPHNFQLL